MKRILVITIFMFACLLNISHAQTSKYNPVLSEQQMKEDILLVQEQLHELHTDLYAFTPKNEFDEFYNQLTSKIDGPRTTMEFFRELVGLNTLIKNGHTNIGIPKSFGEGLAEDLLRLPLAVHVEGDSIRILRSTDRDHIIPNGSYLISINGESALDLFREFQSKAACDGFIKSGTELFIEGYFSYNYAMHRGNPEKYSVVYEDAFGRKEVSIDGLALPEVRSIYNERYGKPEPGFWSSDEPALSLEFDSNIAVLTIKTFDESTIKKRNKKSKKWFKAAFEEIEENEVSDLIIDMRGNGGGDQAASLALLSHLVKDEFLFYDEIYTQKRKISKPKLYGFDARLINMTAWMRTKKVSDNKYSVKLAGTKPVKGELPFYKGNIYVLTDGDSFSQSGETAGGLKEHTNAVFIGVAPGGSPSQNVSGVMLPLVLPNSNIRVSLPIIMWKMNVDFGRDGSPLEMDYEIRPSYEDKVQKIDRVMKFTKDLISNPTSSLE